jgi:hypothetical protein
MIVCLDACLACWHLFHLLIPCYLEQGVLRGVEWMVKILTDPFTDIVDFYSHWKIDPKYFLDFKDSKATYKLDLKTKKICKVE